MREKLKTIDEKLQNQKEELENIKFLLVAHYHNILSEGTDTR
jgi:hypothetical protein